MIIIEKFYFFFLREKIILWHEKLYNTGCESSNKTHFYSFFAFLTGKTNNNWKRIHKFTA